MQEQKIKCPSCETEISIDEVMTRQIEAKVLQKYKAEQKEKEKELTIAKEALEKQTQEIESARRSIDVEVNKKVAEQISAEKITLWKKAREEANKEKESERKLLEEQLAEKDEKLKLANEKELEIRKEKNKLEEDKKEYEIKLQRQLDEERKKIAEEASKKASEEQQHNIGQLKKQLSDAIKAKDELTRKLEQGSQQTQGEVLELELEELLKKEFPQDEITPVPKGVNGADIIQKIYDNSGRECGQIVWESKKTKNWTEGWIQKLKDDQRTIKADLAVIVSIALPQGVRGFEFRDGVWVCDLKLSLALASALRTNLISLYREKAMSVGKNKKMEVLYAYLTGVEFKQRVEAIVEGFTTMKTNLEKEKLAYQKIWSEREKQIEKIVSNTVGMYGDLSGLASLTPIKMLELPKK